MVKYFTILLAIAVASCGFSSSAFAPVSNTHTTTVHRRQQVTSVCIAGDNDDKETNVHKMNRYAMAFLLSASITASCIFGGGIALAEETAKYDGFADYAKENQMEKSDVGCFMDKCGDQTKALFSNPEVSRVFLVSEDARENNPVLYGALLTTVAMTSTIGFLVPLKRMNVSRFQKILTIQPKMSDIVPPFETLILRTLWESGTRRMG